MFIFLTLGHGQLSEATGILVIIFCQVLHLIIILLETVSQKTLHCPDDYALISVSAWVEGNSLVFEWSFFFFFPQDIRSLNWIQSLFTLSISVYLFFVCFVLVTHIFQEGVQFSMTIGRCFSRIFNDNDVFVDKLVLARRGFVSHQWNFFFLYDSLSQQKHIQFLPKMCRSCLTLFWMRTSCNEFSFGSATLSSLWRVKYVILWFHSFNSYIFASCIFE